MILLLHGDDSNASRNALRDAIVRFSDREIRRIDGRIFDEGSLVQALESRSLFGAKYFVVIENFLTLSGKKTSQVDRLGTLLREIHDIEVIIWESKRIPPTLITSLGSHVTVREFSDPPVIFRFLDSLRPGSSRNLLHLYEQIGKKDKPELIHSHLSKRIRQLIMMKDSVKPDVLAPWQVNRLTSQVRFFTMDELTALHRKLLDMEYNVKTGTTPFTLSELIEQAIIELS